jgi:hypothetical protein
MAERNNKHNSAVKAGKCIRVAYKSREIRAIVIDPNGLGKGQPSIGLGFCMIEEHIGIRQNTLSSWAVEKEGSYILKLPSGKALQVNEMKGDDGNSYMVIEASDWVGIAKDLIKHPGKTKKNTINEVVDFLAWFAVDEFYAQAYTAIKRVYTHRDSRALEKWKEDRELGKPKRKDYSSYIHSQDRKHGKWTNIVYQGLFGVNASTMRQIWATQAGTPKIARNHIPESMGLQAVAHCEKLVVLLGLDNLREAHAEAIRLTRKKFGFDQQDSAA